MKIEIVMEYDDRYAVMGDFSSLRAKAYADKQGYAFTRFHSDQIVSPCWHKVWRVHQRQLWSHADYLFWMDADVLILDMDFDLSTLASGAAMDVSQDDNGLCAGCFGVKTQTLDALDLVSAWLFLEDVKDWKKFGNAPLHDQATLMLLDREFPKVNGMINRIPETVIANPQTREAPNPFAFHFWCRGSSPEVVLQAMKKKLLLNYE